MSTNARIANTAYARYVCDTETTNHIVVQTPDGTLSARVSNYEYPGICVESEDVPGNPGIVMEYDPVKKYVQARVYDIKDPDGEPSCVFRMS